MRAAFDGKEAMGLREQDAERDAKFKSMLRLNLSVSDGNAPVYWKHDGQRFAGKAKGGAKPNDWLTRCSGSTLKLCSGKTYHLILTSNRPVQIRENSGRWNVKEVDSEGREVEPQFGALPSHSHSQFQPQPRIGTISDSTAQPSWSQQLSEEPQLGAAGGNAGIVDPHALQWTDVTADATRSTYKATLRCSLPPTTAGRRQYLLMEAYLEDFGVVVCPVQLKVYSPTDKGALQSFPLRFVQYDFREDSSGAGDLFAVNFYRY